mmetsp:Transcript_4310/g.13074  ORF Transcript_4310/g.13074 Transcript_4310/m.13074 type:complete len:302 (+) Transcript_4310:1346-2251(+)
MEGRQVPRAGEEVEQERLSHGLVLAVLPVLRLFAPPGLEVRGGLQEVHAKDEPVCGSPASQAWRALSGDPAADVRAEEREPRHPLPVAVRGPAVHALHGPRGGGAVLGALGAVPGALTLPDADQDAGPRLDRPEQAAQPRALEGRVHGQVIAHGGLRICCCVLYETPSTTRHSAKNKNKRGGRHWGGPVSWFPLKNYATQFGNQAAGPLLHPAPHPSSASLSAFSFAVALSTSRSSSCTPPSICFSSSSARKRPYGTPPNFSEWWMVCATAILFSEGSSPSGPTGNLLCTKPSWTNMYIQP